MFLLFKMNPELPGLFEMMFPPKTWSSIWELLNSKEDMHIFCCPSSFQVCVLLHTGVLF